VSSACPPHCLAPYFHQPACDWVRLNQRHPARFISHRRCPSGPPPQEGKTPLHIATIRGCLDVIDKLLDLDANIGAKDNEVPSPAPLARAAYSLDAAAPTNPHRRTHAHAGAHRRSRARRHRLAYGFTKRPPHLSGAQARCTPLHFAACCDQTAVVERLVERGADIEAKNKVRSKPRPCQRGINFILSPAARLRLAALPLTSSTGMRRKGQPVSFPPPVSLLLPLSSANVPPRCHHRMATLFFHLRRIMADSAPLTSSSSWELICTPKTTRRPGAPFSWHARPSAQPRSRRHLIAPLPQTHTPAGTRRRASKEALAMSAAGFSTADQSIAPGTQGYTPIHSAAFCDQAAVLQRLVEKGADIKAQDKVRAHSPLRQHRNRATAVVPTRMPAKCLVRSTNTFSALATASSSAIDARLRPSVPLSAGRQYPSPHCDEARLAWYHQQAP
jgi:hypothetical protein